MERIYLDHAATTPMLPEAIEAMGPWLGAEFGNPSSLYEEGRRAKAAIDRAREVLAQAMGCRFGEVIFTSGGTESVNLAIIGAALKNTDKVRKRVLFSAAEHHSVLHTQPILERLGYNVQLLKVDDVGRVRLDELERYVARDVLLVSLMHANNEIGTLHAINDLAVRINNSGALLHADCVQTFMGPNFNVEKLGADLVSVAAHKVGGPKGVGALYVKARTPISPTMVGGGQERELRAGTENVAAIVGFAAAIHALAKGSAADRSEKKRKARDAFMGALTNGRFVETVKDRFDALPGFAHLRAPGIDAETMLIRLDRMGVSASSGAACSSGSINPSHVLLACGYPINWAKEGLRFTFSHLTTEEEARRAGQIVSEAATEIDASKNI
jgi:cysteine desulfurase